MIHSTIRLGLVALAALGVAAAATAGGTSDGFTCGVNTVADRGLVAIEGIVQSPTQLSGDYRFALRSSGSGGSTNISQGGAFVAEAATPLSLGKVTINAGSNIVVDFTVTTNGKKLDCSGVLDAAA